MANIGSFALKVWREMDKELTLRRELWVTREQEYDDGGNVDGRRLWPRRTTMQLWDEYADKSRGLSVRDGHWNDIVEKHKRLSMPKMEFMWEMQAQFQQAKLNVAERLGLHSTQNYFITIRPDETKVNFEEFHTYIQKFVSRACFLSYHLSFEQKGLTTAELGKGFHAHIVAHMKQRSKGEVLRDTCSTFEKIAAANCIDVQLATRPEGIINKYLKHISDDGHKEATADSDAAWRTALGLQEIYTDLNPIRKRQPIKSNRLSTFSITEVS